MTQSISSDDLKQLFTFPFQDERWQNKFLIGSLIVLGGYIIPVVPFLVVYGYMAQIMRRIIVEKGEPYLPEWDDWGKLITDGAKLLGAVFVYMLPILIFLCGGYIFLFATVGLSATAAATAENSGEAPSTIAAIGPLFGTVGFLAMFGIIMIYSLAIGLFLPAPMAHLIATDQFSAAFRIRECWAIFKANLAGFFIAYALFLAVSVALSFVFSILYVTIIGCCLMPFLLGPVTLYSLVIYGTVFSEAYNEGVQNLSSQPASI